MIAQLANQNFLTEANYISSSLITLNNLFLYLEDNPAENRLFLNKIGNLFENHIKQEYDYIPSPITFKLAQQKTNPKLKIGYIGRTLRCHSVGWLSRWLMQYHNKDNFDLNIYLICQPEDYVTEQWFRKNASSIKSFGSDINEIVREIRKDDIDILVDLDSFTSQITNIIMALKPASIQVSWLGMDTPGIPSIDYLITDPYVLPDNAQEYDSEKIWRLPSTYLAIDGFEIDVPTLKREHLDIDDQAIIYLNIQSALKRNPRIIHLQMKIIKAIPNSYLLIKGQDLDETGHKLFEDIALEEGVSKDQLRFLPFTPTEAIHRANLSIADVVLDTYPYNGATTTLETLWREIPLVTRVGEQFAARNSYTFMMNAGITEGIAWSDEEYVEWGIKIGTDEQLRKEISWKLKQSKKTSPLWNGKQFAVDMETAYQQMWEIYLQNNNH